MKRHALDVAPMAGTCNRTRVGPLSSAARACDRTSCVSMYMLTLDMCDAESEVETFDHALIRMGRLGTVDKTRNNVKL